MVDFLNGYFINVGVIAGIYIILSLGLNITIGYAGQPSLGHAAFWAIGCYISAILTTVLNVNFWFSLPITVLLTGIIGLFLGIPSIRVRDDFLVIVTLGLCLIVQSLVEKLEITGGSLGISNIPSPSLFGSEFGLIEYIILVFLFVVLCAYFSKIIERSWLGLSFKAIRNDDLAAESMGTNIKLVKILSFSIGASYAGLAGVLYAHYMNFISGEMFGLNESVLILSMIVIGGLGSIKGVIIGALLISTAPETMRWAADYRLSIIGLLMLLVILYRPQGIKGATE
jgi:branched-chain amino acid transport system permease protein